jgi:hypothetical protein
MRAINLMVTVVYFEPQATLLLLWSNFQMRSMGWLAVEQTDYCYHSLFVVFGGPGNERLVNL